jgi:hypothetical protein
MDEKETLEWKMKVLINNVDEMKNISPELFIYLTTIVDNIYWFYCCEYETQIKMLLEYSDELVHERAVVKES